jgi:hypothetical protein
LFSRLQRGRIANHHCYRPQEKVTAHSGEQRRIASFEGLDREGLQVQPLLQVVDFSGSCAPALALAGLCLVFA